MRQKNIVKQILFTLLFMAVLLAGGVLLSKLAVAAEGDELKAVYYSDIATYRGNENIAPVRKGYVFGGWYKDQDLTQPYTTDKSTGDAWAKFVPEAVLSVKVQATGELYEDAISTTGALRFVTTVDGLNYSSTGFKYQIGDKNPAENSSTLVYTSLNAITANGKTGEADTRNHSPSEFCSLSTYFKTWILKNIPTDGYGTTVKATPFWVTLDGTKVYGATTERTVYYQIDASYEEYEGNAVARVGQTHYTTLASAVSAAGANPVILLKDVEQSAQISIASGQNITIQNPEGKSVGIYRGTGLGTGNIFNVASGGSLTLTGSEAESSADGIIIDGRTMSEAANSATVAAATGGSLISNSGTVSLTGVTLQYGNGGTGSSTQGSAIYSKGVLNISECAFLSNQASNQAGGIYMASQSSTTVEDTLFSGNKTTTGSGGTLCMASATKAEFSDCQFKNSVAGSSGGVIKVEGGANNTFTECVFDSNTAGSDGGVLNANNVCTVTFTDCQFTDNKATGHGGAVYVSNTGPNYITVQYTELGADIVNSGNTAKKSSSNAADGGGFARLSGTGGYLTLIGGTYKKNSATASGGVVQTADGHLTATNVTFVGNTSTAFGGAVSKSGSSTDITLTDCVFRENAVTNGKGGAISSTGNNTSKAFAITGCTFEGNTASSHGGALYGGGKMTVANTDFVNNTGNTGGAYMAEANSNTTFTNVNFDHNTASTNGGTIRLNNESAYMTLEDVTFKGNTGVTGKGDVYLQKMNTATLKGKIEGGLFGCGDVPYRLTVDSAGLDAGSHLSLLPLSADYDGSNVVVKGNLASAAQYIDIAGQSNYYLTSEGKIAQITETNVAQIDSTLYTSLNDAFAAVTDDTETTITLLKDSEISTPITIGASGSARNIKLVNAARKKVTIFRGNSLSGDLFTVAAGSTFTIEGDGTKGAETIVLDGRTQSEVKAGTFPAATSNKGNLIQSAGVLKLTNATLQYCKGETDADKGGAVSITAGGSLVLDTCRFANNSGKDGAAINALGPVASGDIVSGSNVVFDRNISTERGGAIDSRKGFITLTDSVFLYNESVDGGGIYYRRLNDDDIKNVTTKLSLQNVTFDHNKATTNQGGAIHQRTSGEVVLTSCNFTGNYAGNYGGAIRTGCTTTAENCNFTDNSAKNYGGAITITDGNTLRLKGTGVFEGNTAGSETKGNAICLWNDSNNATINVKDLNYNYTFKSNPNQTVSRTPGSGGEGGLRILLTNSEDDVASISNNYVTTLFDMSVFRDGGVTWTALSNTVTTQGGWTDGEFYYQAFVNQNSDPYIVKIIKYNMANGKVVAKSEGLTVLGKANDLTCYSDASSSYLVVCHGRDTKNVTYLDKDTLTVRSDLGTSGTAALNDSMFAIDYNATNQKYVVGIEGGQKFRIMGSDLNASGTTVYLPTLLTCVQRSTGASSSEDVYTRQGVGSDSNYIYFILWNKTGADAIATYDWNGNFVRSLQLPEETFSNQDKLEPENISVVDGNIYIGTQTAEGVVTVYKVQMPENILGGR